MKGQVESFELAEVCHTMTITVTMIVIVIVTVTVTVTVTAIVRSSLLVSI